MLITIKYFGYLTEVTNCDEEIVNFTGMYISDLLDGLYSKHPNLKNKIFQVAQNNELTPFESEVTTKEIALLPPFSGG